MAALSLSDCDGNIGNNIDSLCNPLQRLISAIKFYSSLDLNDNTDKTRFMDFFNNIYVNLLNDFQHLTSKHHHQIYEINQLLLQSKQYTPCDISKCEYTSRHHQSDTSITSSIINEDGDNKLHFYKTKMDSLHFYLFHLFQSGLRIHTMSYKDKQPDNDTNTQYIDTQFQNISNAIKQRRKATASFHRLQNNQKFNIHVLAKDMESSMTFIDHLFKYLQRSQVNHIQITKLKIYIINQQYDTDAIKMDLSYNASQDIDGNINMDIFGKLLPLEVSEFIQTESCMIF